MGIKKMCWLVKIICLVCLTAHAQETLLQSGQPIEREIAGGESHTYKIALTKGQFVHFLLVQRTIDAGLILVAPDGKQLSEIDFTGHGESESLRLEAPIAGDYQLTVRGSKLEGLQGTYRVEVVVQAVATPLDRQRLQAETLLLAAKKMWQEEDNATLPVLEKSQQALTLWRELNEPSWIANALDLMATVYDETNQSEKALEYYQEELQICREFRLRTREALTLCNIGLVYRGMSKIEEERNFFAQALEISRELKDRLGEGRARLHLSVTYFGMSQIEQAIEICEQALAIAREIKDRKREVNALNNLAAYYGARFRFDKKREFLEQGLAANRLAKDRLSEHQSLHNLGVMMQAQQQNEQSMVYYEQALATARAIKNKYRESATLSAMGELYAELKQYEKAVACYDQALLLAREIHNRSSECHTLRVLGVAQAAQNQFAPAIATLEKSLSLARENKEPIYELYILADLARTENRRNNLLSARSFIEDSLRIAEMLRVRNDSFAMRSAFFTLVQKNYRLYTDILMRQHQTEPTKGFDALAVEISERQRARSLLDMLTEARTDLRQGVDAGLIESAQRIAKLLTEKAQAQAQSPTADADTQRAISQLETDLERAQIAIRKASPRYASLMQPHLLKLKEIQQQLDSNTVMLEYSLGEERSYLWAITNQALTSYELPQESVVEKNARQVYELLTARGTNKRGETTVQRRRRIAQAEAQLPIAAQALSQILLAPVAAQLGNKRLVIVADGALQYVPFGMLPEPDRAGAIVALQGQAAQRKMPNAQPLIVDHEIVNLPSASVLAMQRSELASRQLAPKMLAVIADPVFDRSDVRFTIQAPEINKSAQKQTLTLDDARSIEHLAENSGGQANVTMRRLVIPRLPYTRQEATRLLALAPKNSSFGATDFQASRDTVLKGDLSQYRYVHFATHGILDSERPGLSALLLSMMDEKGQAQNGFLRTNDIYNLKLPAELVVLSACQTGLGKEIKGEGLVGLTRGFMYAGAARVVVSLWNVNDQATAELMAKFYQKMFIRGESSAAALRAAQVEMWQQKQWQAPYYWAAFALQGEWK